jgi:glycosyltransferase involved in cell wall biosynthesis
MRSRLRSKLWPLARLLTTRIRREPGRNGASLRIAVLADPLLRYSAAQAIGLKQAGAEVTLYYVDNLHQFDGSAQDRALFLAQVEERGIEVVRLSPRRLARTLGQTRELLRDLRSRGITGIVVQQHFDPRYTLACLRLPTLLVLHDPRPHSGDLTAPPWPAPVVARFAEGTASCLMLHSERLVPQIQPSLRALPRIVIPHGSWVAPEPTAKPTSPVVLVTGRLLAYKGVDSALDVFPEVRHAIPDARLVVAGRGPMAAEARLRELPGVTVEDGYVPESRLDELLDAASVVLLPYRDATQSGVGLLAVGRGIPCVVTEQGALPDIMGPLGKDLVWASSDLSDLARAIVAALEKDDEFRGAAHRYAAEHFAWNVVGSHLIDEISARGFGVVEQRTT